MPTNVLKQPKNLHPLEGYWTKHYYKFNDPRKQGADEYDPLIEKHPLPPIKNIVLQGGGTKVTGASGVLDYFRKHPEQFENVTRVAGSSGGAMSAIFFALDYTAKDMAKSLDFKIFKDLGEDVWWDPLRLTLPIKIAYRLATKNGACKGEAAYDWASNLIAKKTGNPNLTFGQLHELTKKNPKFKDMYITGTCIDDEVPLKYFNWETTPNMPVALAVRISMGFPGGFNAIDIEGKKYIDGGAIDNYPMKIFDNEKYMNSAHAAKFGLNKTGSNPCSLGFRPKTKTKPKLGYFSFVTNAIGSSYPAKLLGAILADNKKIQDKYYANTVSYDDTGFSALQEHVPPEQKKKAIKSGHDSTEQHMKLYKDPNYYYDIKTYKNLEEKYDNLKLIEVRVIYKNLFKFANNPKGMSQKSLVKINEELNYIKKHYPKLKDIKLTSKTSKDTKKSKASRASTKVAKLMESYCKVVNHQRQTEKLVNNITNKLESKQDKINATKIKKQFTQIQKPDPRYKKSINQLSKDLSNNKLSKKALYSKVAQLDDALRKYINNYNTTSARVLNFLTHLLPDSVMLNKLFYLRKAITLRKKVRSIRKEMQTTTGWAKFKVDELYNSKPEIAKILHRTNELLDTKKGLEDILNKQVKNKNKDSIFKEILERKSLGKSKAKLIKKPFLVRKK